MSYDTFNKSAGKPAGKATGQTDGKSQDDKIKLVQVQVEEVTNIMRDNVDKVIARGEDIDNVLAKAEQLDESSKHFYNSSSALRKKFCRRDLCQKVAVVLFILIVLLIIILSATKPWQH
jgi:hypothetical protein